MVYIQYIKGERIALVTPDFHGRHHPEVLFWLLFDRREEGVGATDQQTLQFPAPCAKQTKGYGADRPNCCVHTFKSRIRVSPRIDIR